MSSPWKCPHCGTPQAEAARCWACKRSPLSCSTCRDFRRSVAGKLGYCGMGKARAVLTGDEVRPCWSAPATVEEPQLLGLFGPAAPVPAPPARQPAASSAKPSAASHAAPGEAAGPSALHVIAEPVAVPVRPAPPIPRGPAPTAAVAARRRWDSIVADVAAGAPLGSEPTGGATPSVPHRPAPGSTPIVPWLATAAHAADLAHGASPTATSTATATPPQGTPAPWSSPIPGASPWVLSTDDLTPSEPIRWRHRAADDPPPPAAADASSPAVPRRSANLSLIPVTLANRLRRHLGTRGPRTDAPSAAPTMPSTPATGTPSALTSPSVRGATPISTARPAPYGRLVDAPPVTGTILSLGDQLRRAEQLRRERALLDGERRGGERHVEPPA